MYKNKYNIFSNINMNFTYFKFLFITTIKKKPVWITWLLYLFTCSAFLIILPAVAKMNVLQVWANTTMCVCQTFLGMTIALFTSILAIHIFKDGVEEGTELIVISKPISRKKIVLTKFFIFGVFCLMLNITALIITAFTAFLPVVEVKFYWKLIFSTFIGNLIAFGVFGSIAILLTIKFAKIGVIITNIIISLIFLIYQCLTLFVMPIPVRSLADHGLTAPSYILSQRDPNTGKYEEDEVVCFKTDQAKQLTQVSEEERNYSVTWKDSISYWTDIICKNDPTKILNVTDWAGQVSLSYLSYGIDDFSFRQAHRMFAVSRFYTYDLISPMSPEIISGVENKKTLPWIYLDLKEEKVEDEEGKTIATIYHPGSFGFAGIAPLGTTRLRGYEDKIPIGFYVKTGEALSSKDVYFEPDEWVKYSKPFDLMYDKLFNFEYYKAYIDDTKILNDPSKWPSAWASNNATINRYYSLVWSCLTGNSNKEEYFGSDFLKDYPISYFDINSVNDLNERFLQFKYYTYYKVLHNQQIILNNAPSQDIEREAKSIVAESTETKAYEHALKIKHSDSNWMMENSGEEGVIPSYVEPNTQTLATQFMHDTLEQLISMADAKYQSGQITLEQKQSIISNASYPLLEKTISIFNNVCDANEEYLFNSLLLPERSASYHGKSYMVTADWTPYWQTLLTPVGQNMQWFFYTTRATVQYWVYAIIWGTLSMAAFAAGAILYNKYDVK